MPTRTDAAIAAVLLVASQVEVWRFGAGGGGAIAAVCLALVAIISAWRTRYPLVSGFGLFVPAASTSPSTSSVGGHGLVGIAERVSLLGGELEASRDSGGFTLRALLPA